MNTASSFGSVLRLMGQLLGELLQVHPANQLHANEANPVVFAQVIGLHNVGVNQIGDQLGLADEILNEHLLAGNVRADDLDGHALDEIARAVLFGFINNAHAALKYFADDFVTEFTLNGE